MQEQVAAREETSEPRYKMKIETDVDIPMRDGAKLKADVFRPDGDMYVASQGTNAAWG